MNKQTFIKTPIGTLKITSDNKGLFLTSVARVTRVTQTLESSSASPLLKKASLQLKDYFKGKRKSFKLPLSKQGTLFQKRVWKELERISYGKTLSYLDVAKKIEKPRAYRAVGSACNKNPFLIITPCHRILKSNQDLGGFALGLKAKKWLLQHEQH